MSCHPTINPQTRQYTTRHKKSVMPSLSRLARGGLGLEPRSISKNAPRLLRVHRLRYYRDNYTSHLSHIIRAFYSK